MKPGSLVIMIGFQRSKMCGVIISEFIEHTDMWNDRPHLYRWWKVLCNNEIIVEVESCLKHIE